ncbi:MAG: hypothetical protein P1P88_23735 [Bacteroidales bacterium]|nr:hypothetical protein [Bacteroidales bacterium]
MEEKQVNFSSWAIVELFGHNQLAGLVTEQVIAGKSYVRIDVPRTKQTPAFTKYHNPDSVYGLTPVDEDYATRMAERINAQPINDYKHNEVISEIIKERLSKMQLELH